MASRLPKKDPEIAKIEEEVGGKALRAYGDKTPDFMRDAPSGGGVEEVRPELLPKPILKLSQKMSPQCDDGFARPGDWWMKPANINLGPSILISPVFNDDYALVFDNADRSRPLARSKWLRDEDGNKTVQIWEPRNTELELTGSDNRKVTVNTDRTIIKSGLLKWGSLTKGDNRSMAGTQFMRCWCILPDHPELGPVAVAFGRSSFAVGATFQLEIRRLATHPDPAERVPAYGQIWKLDSVEVEKNNRKYLVYRVKWIGKIQDEELYNLAKNAYMICKTEERLDSLETVDDYGDEEEAGPATLRDDI